MIHHDHSSHKPLPSNPELEIISISSTRPSSTSKFLASTTQPIEIRVYNYRYDNNGMLIRYDTGPLGIGGWGFALILIMSLVLGLGRVFTTVDRVASEVERSVIGEMVKWSCFRDGKIAWGTLCMIPVILVIIWKMSTTVLYESITPIPNIGVQITTTHGLSFPLPFSFTQPTFPLSTSRKFIPLSAIGTIVINEGLSLWSIGYYLALVGRDDSVIVVFDAIRPKHAVLRETYHLLREILYDEFDDDNGESDHLNTTGKLVKEDKINGYKVTRKCPIAS